MKEQVCLSKETKDRLASLDPTSQVHRIIHFANVIVGVVIVDPFDTQVLLPGGIENSTREDLTVADLFHADEVDPPSALTLRYRTCISVSSSNCEEIANTVAEASIVTIDGTVIKDGQTLSDIVEDINVSPAREVEIFLNSSDEGEDKLIAPVFDTHTSGTVFKVAVDALAHVVPNASRDDILTAIATAVRRNVRASYDLIQKHHYVRTSHFRVLGGSLAVTLPLAYRAGGGKESSEEAENDSKSIAWRRSVHTALALPLDRPFFRRACRAFTNSSNIPFDGGLPGRLSNVHEGIKAHGLGDDGVTVHFTDGQYLYYHYMQDKLNDSGWGCAYRSLQTLMSWCVFQKYTRFDKQILPTHVDIQRALVDIGDKPDTFIGSKEWIGANEVCYALEKLTGIESKILHVSRGSEMMSKGRELARHFDEEGSPVMVGGGVLAWTILGVARNNRTGKTNFLILDPHYEGRDDLSIIQNKGWVGWKSDDIFKATTFYNLCMPQRPNSV